MNFYRQCELRLNAMHKVAWIPESFAKEGKTLKIKQDSQWVNGWKVESVGARQDEEFVQIAERMHLKHRTVTDI